MATIQHDNPLLTECTSLQQQLASAVMVLRANSRGELLAQAIVIMQRLTAECQRLQEDNERLRRFITIREESNAPDADTESR